MTTETPTQIRIEDALVSFGVLRLQPGDILVFMYPGKLSNEGAQRLAESAKAVLPAGVRAIMLDQGLTVGRITFGEDAHA